MSLPLCPRRGRGSFPRSAERNSPLRFSSEKLPARKGRTRLRSSRTPVSRCRNNPRSATGMRPRFSRSEKVPQNEEKRDIRPRCCTAPSRFLAINKNGGEREELSKPSTDDVSNYSTPPLAGQDSNVPKSPLQFVHNCTIRQFTQQYSAETDNLYKNRRVFSSNPRPF